MFTKSLKVTALGLTALSAAAIATVPVAHATSLDGVVVASCSACAAKKKNACLTHVLLRKTLVIHVLQRTLAPLKTHAIHVLQKRTLVKQANTLAICSSSMMMEQ